MWRLALLRAVAVLLLGVLTIVAPVQAQSPVDQAAQAGFPLLTEFTLKPGDQPFTYRYTAQADGPHRMVAAWGATVAIRLEVHGAGPDPSGGQGNPASVPFEGEQGVEYTIRVSPAANLPITSVGQLYGGLRRAQATVVTTGELIPATPIPLPGPEAPGSLPVPIPGPQPALKPLPSTVIAKLMAPVDWAATLKAANANPVMGQLLSSLPGGVAGTAQDVSDNATRVRAPTVPESTGALDWRAGLKLRFWSEPPAYYVNGKKCYVAALEADAVQVGSYAPLATDQTEGILRLGPRAPLTNPQPPVSGIGGMVPAMSYSFARVTVALELPPEVATYAVTVRTTDSDGVLWSHWAAGSPPVVRLTCLRPWMDTAHKVEALPLTMAAGPAGFTTLMAVSPENTPTYADALAPGHGMRKVNLILVLTYMTGPNKSGAQPPFLFGGMDIVRIN